MGEGILQYGLGPAHNRQQSISRFVADTLADGKPRGKAQFVSNLPSIVYQRMHSMGVNLSSDHVFLPDNTVLKYRDHPKGVKGATLPFNRFWSIANIARNPASVYIDSKSKNLVFVFASRYVKGKVVKAIIQPNYRFKGKSMCAITSIGVVDKREMKHPQYKKIK